jgi:2-polyprenyl-3-methyl-5-hydroxy-6-metoxy-1,4-benzoquinol methylase
MEMSMTSEHLISMSGDAQQADVHAANVAFFHETASKFDSYESHMFDRETQQMLEQDLNRIAERLTVSHRRVRCLDCGGGTGNLTLKMLKRGWNVTVVDISSDMLAILRKKITEKGYSATLVCEPVENFLRSTTETYDVISFGSVLHHLHSYLAVVDLASKRINPGGFFYTSLDPVRSRFAALTRAFTTLDTILAKALLDPQDFFPGTMRRLKKLFVKRDQLHQRAVAGMGDIADYHAITGIDPAPIVELLQRKGFDAESVRYADGRISMTRFVNRYIPLMQQVKITAQRFSNPS